MADRILLALLAICVATGALAQSAPRQPSTTTKTLQADFVFDNAVRQTRDLPTASLRALRRAMLAGEVMGMKDLRSLADAGDGLAAFRLAKMLEAEGKPDPTGIAAHYYAIAAYTGRVFAVPPLARLLKNDGAEYSPSRLTNALNAMTVQALSGNPEAATLLGQMYAAGIPFGRDPTQAQAYLAMASGEGSMAALLQLGVALMSDPTDTASGNPGARAALRLAAAGDDLAVRVTAENLLRLMGGSVSSKIEVSE